MTDLPLVLNRPVTARVADRCFDMTQEGLYQFWNWGEARWNDASGKPEAVGGTRYFAGRLLYRGDILTFLGGLCVIHLHGGKHDGLSVQALIERARTNRLSLTCGYVSVFAVEVLKALGWRARVVSGLASEGPYNLHDNGHTLFELFWPDIGKWMLVDIDLHRVFRRDGTYLDFGEFNECLRKGIDVEMVSLTPPGVGAVDTASARA